MNSTRQASTRFSEPVEITEPWASAFRKAGLVAPNTDEPSIQALARAADVHPSAISRIIGGRTRKPRPQTIVKMAQALDVDFVTVAQWVGMPWTSHEPWTPPAEASLMTPRQRDMIETLIRELVRSEQKEN